jgi:hypothetical protein
MRKSFMFWAKMAVGVSVLATSPVWAAVRVALVTTGTPESTSQVIALATAQIDDKDIQFVDRESISGVLKEQKLSLSGLVDPDRAIEVGKMLKADLFGVLETDAKGKRPLGLTIFDSSNGLRLTDLAVDMKDEEAAAKLVASEIESAVAKDRSIKDGLRVVGFLPVRNADLPIEREDTCETVRILLERQLTGSPGIAVLERTRLEHVNEERRLPTTERLGDLKPSLVLVQLEIGRSAKGNGLRATATLTSAAGQSLGKVAAETEKDSPADVADALRDRLIESLKVKPIEHASDRASEARRFARDSDVLVHNARMESGRTAAEAAYALGSTDANRLFLATALWARAWELLTPNDVNLTEMETGWYGAISPPVEDVRRSIALATRAVALQSEALKEATRVPRKGQYFMDYTGGEERITFIEGFANRLDSVQNPQSQLAEPTSEFRAAATQYLIDYYDHWSRKILATPDDLTDYDAEILNALDAVAAVSATFKDYVTTRDFIVKAWMKSFDQTWNKTRELWPEDGLRQSQLMLRIFELSSVPAGHWPDFAADALAKSLISIAPAFNQSSAPVMQMYGVIADALADPSVQEKRLADFWTLFEHTLQEPGARPTRTRKYAFVAAVDVVEILPAKNKHSRRDDFIHILNIGLRRKVLIPQAAVSRLWDGITADDEGNRNWIETVQKTLDLARSPDVHVLDGNRDGVVQELTSHLHDVHQDHPKLAKEDVVRPWESARRLVEFSQLSGIARLEEFPKVLGNSVCFLGSGKDQNSKFFIQAFEMSLDGGTPKPLAKMFIDPLPDSGDDRSHFGDGFVYRLIESGAVDEQNYYVSVRGQGVIVFPRNGSPAERINTDAGLPSNWTQDIVVVGDTLYIASSSDAGGYLVAWDLNKRSASIRVSSLRAQKQSPLDNTAGLSIEFMTYDAPRKRLLLATEMAPSSKDSWRLCRGGLWEMKVPSGKLKQLLTERPSLDMGKLRGLDADTLVCATTLWVVKYDLNKDRGEYMSWKPGTLSESYIRELPLKKSTPRGTGWAEPRDEQAGMRWVIDHWLWLGDPFSRISADGRTVQALDPQLMAGAKPIGPVWTILPAGDDRLLLGDIRQLYVVKLKTETTSAAPPATSPN